MTFQELGIDSDIVDALAAKGITEPFPIQEQAIPLALTGQDIIGQAKTGTVKSFGFGLPLIQSLGFDTTDAMDPYTERVQTFHSNTTGIDWYEAILKIYLVSGVLDDFYRRLAVGLSPELREEVEKALNDKIFERFAKRVLLESMKDNPQLQSRLALWGRRLMGDVLLELRAVFDNRKLAGLPKGKVLTLDQERQVNLTAYSQLEPLVTELMAAHSLRMDALGLTA